MQRVIRIFHKIRVFLFLRILKINRKRTKNINGINLCVNTIDPGGKTYFSPSYYKDVVNPFYQIIESLYSPNIVLDIGANYGFTSNLFAKIFKHSKTFAIEPSSQLIKFIEINKELNNTNNLTIVKAICDDSAGEEKNFSLNPIYSQDNRVQGESSLWFKEKVATTSIDSLLHAEEEVKFAFIKIDTQGFEERVFKGGEDFLKESSNWLIKTEFCPHCLSNQGTDPKKFLTELIEKYDVVDFNAMLQFNESSLEHLFTNKLKKEQIDGFIQYIMNFDHKNIGWTDLLIRSQQVTNKSPHKQ